MYLVVNFTKLHTSTLSTISVTWHPSFLSCTPPSVPNTSFSLKYQKIFGSGVPPISASIINLWPTSRYFDCNLLRKTGDRHFFLTIMSAMLSATPASFSILQVYLPEQDSMACKTSHLKFISS